MPRRKAGATERKSDEWELYRKELHRLFMGEEKSIHTICDYMRAKHNFHKKPRDYENRLREWKYYRNIKKNQLRFVLDQLWLRRREGKESVCFNSGKRWPLSRLKGRAERHKFPWPLEGPLEAWTALSQPDSEEPLIRVQTPSPMMADDLPQWPKALPWIQFNDQISSAHRFLESREAKISVPKLEGQKPMFVELICAFTTDHPTPGPSRKVYFESVDDSPNSPPNIRDMLEALCPPVYDGEHEARADILHTGTPDSVASQIIQLIMYLSANDMMEHFSYILGVDVELDRADHMMDFLRRMGLLTKTNIDMLIHARTPGSTSEAFLDLLLKHSVEDDKSCDVLELIINRGFDVNSWMDATTLLLSAIRAGNVSAVRVLLRAGADANQTIQRRIHSPLECAASLRSDDDAVRILELLMSESTTLSPFFWEQRLDNTLCLALKNENAKFVSRLLRKDPDRVARAICPKHFRIAAGHANLATISLLFEHYVPSIGDRNILLRDVLISTLRHQRRLTDPDLVLSIVRYLLGHGADPTRMGCSEGCYYAFALEEAVSLPLPYKMEIESSETLRSRVEEHVEVIMTIINLLRLGKHRSPLERPRATPGWDWMPSTLQVAIASGSSRLVEFFLDEGADINHLRKASHQEEPVCQSCRSQNWKVLSLKGSSPLLTALILGRGDIAKILLRRKPRLKLRGGELAWAMTIDDVELLTRVLEAGGFQLDEKNGHMKLFTEAGVGFNHGRLLQQAVWERNQAAISLLMSTGTIYINPTVILEAVLISGNYEASSAAIAVSNYSSRALYEAVVQSPRTGDHNLVKRLLNIRKISPNDQFEIFAVASACLKGDVNLLGILVPQLAAGPWVARFPRATKFPRGACFPHHNNRWGLKYIYTLDFRFPFRDESHHAYETTRTHILQFAAEFDSDHKGTASVKTLTDLKISAESMRLDCTHLTTETVQTLLQAGANPNPPESPTEWTPLESAIRVGCVSTVQLLLDANASANTEPKLILPSDGFTDGSYNALQRATHWTHLEIVDMLLDKEADVNAPPGYFEGATCLQYAAQEGQIGRARVLLHKGAKVNAKRSLITGRTAIEAAATFGRMDMLKLLLLQEENLFREEHERYQFVRAAKLALSYGHHAVSQMVKKHINWNSEDQRKFEEADINDGPFIDGMTQKPSLFERRHPDFLKRLKWLCKDDQQVEVVKQWLGGGEAERNHDAEGDVGISSADLSSSGQLQEAQQNVCMQPCDFGGQAAQQHQDEEPLQEVPYTFQPDLIHFEESEMHRVDMASARGVLLDEHVGYEAPLELDSRVLVEVPFALDEMGLPRLQVEPDQLMSFGTDLGSLQQGLDPLMDFGTDLGLLQEGPDPLMDFGTDLGRLQETQLPAFETDAPDQLPVSEITRSNDDINWSEWVNF